MSFKKIEATAVVRKNSTDFIQQVFLLNEARRPLVTVSDLSHAENLPGVVVDRCIVPTESSGWYSVRHALIHDDAPAQISFTSGTEGKPKGIVLTYANLSDAAGRIIDEMQMTADIREYVGVPATYSFGMGRYRAISAVGGQAYLPPRGFDPLELSRMLAAGEVNALSAVPTLLRIILESPNILSESGENLRWMEIGSQHMTADEKIRIREMFPKARIVQHYGLTEASRTTFLRISEAPDNILHSVGRPAGHTEIKLGHDNRIHIRGPHVAKSRIDENGFHDLQNSAGWLETNDLGHMENGDLFFDGRADDIINCGGIKISPDDLEDRIRGGLAADEQVSVAKVPDPRRGDGILVAIEADQSRIGQVRELADAALNEMGIAAGTALHVIAVPHLPETDTGKVQRRLLADQFLKDQKRNPAVRNPQSDDSDDIIALFSQEFPGATVTEDDSFDSLGGDSLTYIQFSLSFEQRFGQLPDKWETMSVAELRHHVEESGKSSWRQLDPSTMLRAFFMICIVALHTNTFIYSSNWGAAYFLILLAGYSVARFQLPEIIRTGSAKTLWGTAKYVAIPAVIVVAILQVATNRFEITPLLLISNYLDPHTLKGYSLYFTEIYVQIIVITAAIFSIKKVQLAFKNHPMTSALVFLTFAIILHHVTSWLWNVDYNFKRTPWNYGWPFALGIVIALAKSGRDKAIALFAALLLTLDKWGISPATYYVFGGCVILISVRTVSVTPAIKYIISEIAAASLFIYFNHYVTTSFIHKIFGRNIPHVEFVLSIVLGIFLSHAYTIVYRNAITISSRAVFRKPA